MLQVCFRSLALPVLVLTAAAALSAPARAQAPAIVSFSGYTWQVRSGGGGPGPNNWDPSNVWVDADGYLHLRVADLNGQWTAAEITSTERLGFGSYQFKLLGRPDALDNNVVLGLFNYPTPDVGPDGTNEIDIEFATWGGAQSDHGNWTVWPAMTGPTRTTLAFAATPNGAASTHRFDWSSRQIAFHASSGLTGASAPYAQWTFAPGDYLNRIPQSPLPVHLNLWLFDGWPPTNGQEAEIVVTAFTFTPEATAPPAIASSPRSQTLNSGSTLVLAAGASGATSYQWFLNGSATPLADSPAGAAADVIAGSAGPQLVITNATAASAGSYICLASNAAGSTPSSPAVLTVAETANPGRLINLSILSTIEGSLSLGFAMGGVGTGGSEPVLIRGIGPSIGPGTVFAVPGVMADPTLKVVQQSNQAPVASNSGWGANQAAVTAADNGTGAFALTDPSSLDSALVAALPPAAGGYSATVAGKSGDNGCALTEIYDATTNYTPASSRLINLSCLTQIAAGHTLDFGFVIGGMTAKTVLIRVAGPALASLFGVGGAMPDPRLQLSPLGDSGTVLAFNAGWGGDPEIVSAANSVGAYAFPNANGLDSAALVTLPPGAYSAQVNSASGAAGTVLVEIYDVP